VSSTAASPQYKYHVAVTKEGSDSKSSIELDRDKNYIMSAIVNPYNMFIDFRCEGRIFHPAYVSQILIYRTEGETKNFQPTNPYNKNSEKWTNLVLQKGTDIQGIDKEDDPDNDIKLKQYEPAELENCKFAQHSILINSINTINDFCKTMITLLSGFFAVYFALLKFLGVEEIGKQTPPLITDLLYLPPAFLFPV
jgi:hypothetical protein